MISDNTALLQQFDADFAKLVEDESSILAKLKSAREIWRGRFYADSEWKSSNEAHRAAALNILNSFINRIEIACLALTPKQSALADKLIKNARHLDKIQFDNFIDSSFSSDASEDTSKLLTSIPERKISDMSANLSTKKEVPVIAMPPALQPENPQPITSTNKFLPTIKTEPRPSLKDLTIIFYGKPKIGKTALAAQAENAIFLATEAGLNHLKAFQVPVPDWATLCSVAGELAAGNHAFSTIVIDTLDNAYQACREHVYKKFNIAHESELQWGKGYSLINNEFKRVLTKLSLLPYGLIMISHCKDEELDTRTGKIKRATLSLPGGGREVPLAIADIILYLDVEQEGETYRRVMRARPALHYQAGDRTNRLPETIEMGASPKIAWDNFLAAYSGNGAKGGAK